MPPALKVLMDRDGTKDVYYMQNEVDDRSAERRYVKECSC